MLNADTELVSSLRMNFGIAFNFSCGYAEIDIPLCLPLF